MNQKAIIVIAEIGEDPVRLGVTITFDPPIKPNDRATPAIMQAFECAEFLASRCTAKGGKIHAR